jgi:RHH-type proline utilization regulon transcriptional repressor/proline dehydrogenase/delta 1-pyrroline-5-carboxylate dehydrogenase
MVAEATLEQVNRALAAARAAAPEWDRAPAETRAEALEATADLMERERAGLMALCVREAGKTIPGALAEVREAVDFCRYYAAEARRLFAAPRDLPGPTGEANSLALHGRGVFACISPWNFPLAIFTGQVAAALAAGNAVIAKPAEQTPLIAAEATRLCSTRPAFPPPRCTSCRAWAPTSARGCARRPRSPAWRSPARPRSPRRSTDPWRGATAHSAC